MRKGGLTELGLQEPGDLLVVVLKRVLDRALAVLGDVIQSEDAGTEGLETRSELERYRQLLGGTTEAQCIDEASQALIASCDTTLGRIASQRSARQAAMNAIITLVRDAVATLAGDNQAFDTTLDQSTARFAAMAQCDDLYQLKARLAVEVSTLKNLAAARQKSWQAASTVFESRVTMLETQLAGTRREAALDPLTRLANRLTFTHTCRAWIESERPQFVLAMIDLDDFKRINDTHGHLVGDRVLRAVAQALESAVRSCDLAARFAGDEFAVLASSVTLRQAEGRMRNVVAQLAKASVQPGDDVGITVSCGIAEFSAGDTVDSLTHRADQALYEAKRGGKNRVAVRTPPFIRDLLERSRPD